MLFTKTYQFGSFFRQQMAGEEMEQIGTSFAAETNRRDEDADM